MGYSELGRKLKKPEVKGEMLDLGFIHEQMETRVALGDVTEQGRGHLYGERSTTCPKLPRSLSLVGLILDLPPHPHCGRLPSPEGLWQFMKVAIISGSHMEVPNSKKPPFCQKLPSQNYKSPHSNQLFQPQHREVHLLNGLGNTTGCPKPMQGVQFQMLSENMVHVQLV